MKDCQTLRSLERAAIDSESTIDYPRVGFYLENKGWISPLIAMVLCIPLLPVIAVLYALVRLTSKGPGFYSQERLGCNGRRFTIYKLRSMVVDAEAGTGPVWATKNDPRTTTIGRILRKCHLDELPQVFNVVTGDMCFVGPRPERPEIAAEIAQRVPRYYHRLAVKPGITGMAQIHLPPDTCLESVRDKLSFDLTYLNDGSLSLDFRVIVATALKVLPIGDRLTLSLVNIPTFLRNARQMREVICEYQPPAGKTVDRQAA